MSFSKQCYAVVGFNWINGLGKITWSCLSLTQFHMDSVYMLSTLKLILECMLLLWAWVQVPFSIASVPGYTAVTPLGNGTKRDKELEG